MLMCSYTKWPFLYIVTYVDIVGVMPNRFQGPLRKFSKWPAKSVKIKPSRGLAAALPTTHQPRAMKNVDTESAGMILSDDVVFCSCYRIVM